MSLEENLTKQTAARVTKKLKLSNVELNYKGNQQQFQFNLEQKEELEEALDPIRNTAAKSLVKEVIEALGKRNKLIRPADRSEAGWRAVEEYIAIEDVPDSDDDRKMRQAEQRAIRKKEAKKRPPRVYNNPVTGPVQRQYYEQQKGPNFVPTDRINLASKLDFSNSRIPQDSPVTFVDNQVTGKPPVLIDKGLFSHSTLSFNQRKCISQQKDSKFCQEKPKTHEESLQVKYNNLRSDYNTNNSDCLITRVVLGNTSCGSDNESYDHEQDSKNAFVKGSLRSNLQYWKEIGASDFILDVIENGHKLPFRTIPDKAEFKNNKSAKENAQFVSDSIKELLESKRIVEVPFKPHIVNPLSVSLNKGKHRLISDLLYVNDHLEKRKVKFEDWKTFQNYISSENYLFKFDLKSGYHHIEIFQTHVTYLGFQWEVDGVPLYFCFAVLPFGLSTAPYIFTEVCRQLVKLWRFMVLK